MIHPVCEGCREELAEPGAILLGPPDALNRVQKSHLCVACWAAVNQLVVDLRRRRQRSDQRIAAAPFTPR